LEFAADSLQADPEIVLAAVKNKGSALVYADVSLRRDRKFMLAAVKADGWAFQFADASIKADREIALTAVRANYKVFDFVDPSFKTDIDFWRVVVHQNGDRLKDAPSDIERTVNLRFIAAETSKYYAMVVLENMKTDLLTLEASTLSKTANWLLMAVKTTTFGRRLFGEVDSELEYYKKYALVASALAGFWETSTDKTRGLSENEIYELNQIQAAAEEVGKITDHPEGPLVKRGYRQEYDALEETFPGIAKKRKDENEKERIRLEAIAKKRKEEDDKDPDMAKKRKDEDDNERRRLDGKRMRIQASLAAHWIFV